MKGQNYTVKQRCEQQILCCINNQKVIRSKSYTHQQRNMSANTSTVVNRANIIQYIIHFTWRTNTLRARKTLFCCLVLFSWLKISTYTHVFPHIFWLHSFIRRVGRIKCTKHKSKKKGGGEIKKTLDSEVWQISNVCGRRIKSIHFNYNKSGLRTVWTWRQHLALRHKRGKLTPSPTKKQLNHPVVVTWLTADSAESASVMWKQVTRVYSSFVFLLVCGHLCCGVSVQRHPVRVLQPSNSCECNLIRLLRHITLHFSSSV